MIRLSGAGQQCPAPQLFSPPLGQTNMILAHLTRHWLARRGQYSFSSWILCVARSLRVLLFYRDHRSLCRLHVYRHYVAAPPNDDLFHHLIHRDYLLGGVELAGPGYVVALPFHLKPLSAMPAKHRRRIGEAARGTLERKLKRTPVRPIRKLAPRATEAV